MKSLYGIGALIIILAIGGGAYYMTHPAAPATETPAPTDTGRVMAGSVPTPGTYTVDTGKSILLWNATKPLIPGYADHGSIALQSGAITVGADKAEGIFTVDMATLKVLGVAAGKEGKETDLEKHLKSDDFFGVTTYPTATFIITSVTPDTGENTYTVQGSLTMHGYTNDISFPATIYLDSAGLLHAEASTKIDRTLYGIKYSSSKFFDNLGSRVIDDFFTLTLNIVATPSH